MIVKLNIVEYNGAKYGVEDNTFFFNQQTDEGDFVMNTVGSLDETHRNVIAKIVGFSAGDWVVRINGQEFFWDKNRCSKVLCCTDRSVGLPVINTVEPKSSDYLFESSSELWSEDANQVWTHDFQIWTKHFMPIQPKVAFDRADLIVYTIWLKEHYPNNDADGVIASKEFIKSGTVRKPMATITIELEGAVNFEEQGNKYDRLHMWPKVDKRNNVKIIDIGY